MRYGGLVVAGGVLCCAFAAWAQDAVEDGTARERNNGDVLQEQMDLHTAGMERRKKKIDAELAALDREALPEGSWVREWAGTYYTGDGLGMNVTIKVAPESGVTYTWYGCLGLYDMNHGEIAEVLDDGLRLTLAFDTDLDCMDFMNDRLYFVRWGDRKYMVPGRQMIELVNGYNQGGFFRESLMNIPRWYEGEVRHRWDETAPEGVPQLPAKWAAMLLTEPLELSITAVEAVPPHPVTGGVNAWAWDLSFDRGRAEGVYEGMEFRLGDGHGRGSVTIGEVGEHDCRGRLVVFGTGDEAEAPEVGAAVVLPAVGG